MKTFDFLLIFEINRYIEAFCNIKFAKNKEEVEMVANSFLRQLRNKFKTNRIIINNIIYTKEKEEYYLNNGIEENLFLVQVYYSFKNKKLATYSFYSVNLK